MSPLLKKSFNSAKCKTLLQLTVQKLKILSKKHALCVKTSRADVARLLEKGQDSSVKTQVDNVFREEKIVALYNLLEQFCELVINRIESIKSERECPSELKEAVASLMYAASGCDEIEELKKISRYLTNKYGTEFSRAAKELRPGCGVNTQVIQNLSSLPLSFDARMRLLKDIATENKITWNYDTTTADSSKQSADLIDGPSHFVSGSQVSNVTIHALSDKRKSASMSMHENEVNGRQPSGFLKNAISSHKMSPKTSLGSPCRNMHQPIKINTNTETNLSSSRAQNAPLDPYSLAKAEGRMDYKFVSDYMGEHITIEHLDSKSSVKMVQHEGQSTSPGSSKLLFNKQMSTAAGRRVEEVTLLELEAASKLALASASEAAEAARAAVAMARKETMERNRLAKTKNSEGRHSKSSSVPELEESSSGPVDDKSTIRAESRFSPRWDNSAEVDTSEDSFKYVVCEESSGSLQDAAKLETITGDHKQIRLTELPFASPSMDNFYSTDAKEQEADWKRNFRQQAEGLHINKEIQQDKFLQTVGPQYDEYDSEEAIEDETPVYPSKNASLKQQHDRLFGAMEVQQDKLVQNGCLAPQFDDDSSEEASEEETPLDKDVQNEYDDICEEDSKEELPFYLKGRPAMVKEDFDAEPARAPRVTRTGLLNDDSMEESFSMKQQGTGEESRSANHREEQLNFSGSQEFIESVHSPSQSILRSQIDDVGGRSGLLSPVAENGSFDGSQKLNRNSLSYEDSSYNKLPSPVSSVRSLSPSGGSSGYEDGDPSSQVKRNLVSDKSFKSYRPSTLEESSLYSPKPSFCLEDGPRAFEPDFGPSTQGIQASSKKYHGMSRRSVRSSRPTQKQETPSRTT